MMQKDIPPVVHILKELILKPGKVSLNDDLRPHLKKKNQINKKSYATSEVMK